MGKQTVELEEVLAWFDLSDEDWDSLTGKIQDIIIDAATREIRERNQEGGLPCSK